MELFLLILFIIFIISLIIQLFYVLYFFVRFVVYKPSRTNFNQPISIIVCAKNEAENITVFLPKILEQAYSDFEVILVDDQSKDNTEYVLKELTQKYSNLKIVKIA
jgi:cellulose synthase/poly-beta-1,6-N-acetylglucosamine synthase-like glycosyltransferase